MVDINGNINLNNGSLILSGSASDVFVVNVTGSATFVGSGGLMLAGGLTANHVLYNFTGTGSISSHVGNVFNGTLLAPNSSFNLDGTSTARSSAEGRPSSLCRRHGQLGRHADQHGHGLGRQRDVEERHSHHHHSAVLVSSDTTPARNSDRW